MRLLASDGRDWPLNLEPMPQPILEHLRQRKDSYVGQLTLEEPSTTWDNEARREYRAPVEG
jgi:hypothetical protein